MKRMQKIVLLEIILCVIIAAEVLVRRSIHSSFNFPAQKTVDAFTDLQPTNDIQIVAQLMHSDLADNKFDVNQYFSVLDGLHAEQGYVLDWVYWNRGGMGGLPVLYIRKIDDAPYVSFEDYVSHASNASNMLYANNGVFFRYLDKIRIDDTPQGFFQFAVLRLLGDRFYLYWHEFYRETFIVCSKQGWKALLQHENARGGVYAPPSAKFVAAAYNLDFYPHIRLGDKKVEINVTTYSPFEGLDLHYFEISREYPHTILTHAHTNLLSHTQPFVF